MLIMPMVWQLMKIISLIIFPGEAAFKATTDERLKQIWMQRYILNFYARIIYQLF